VLTAQADCAALDKFHRVNQVAITVISRQTASARPESRRFSAVTTAAAAAGLAEGASRGFSWMSFSRKAASTSVSVSMKAAILVLRLRFVLVFRLQLVLRFAL